MTHETDRQRPWQEKALRLRQLHESPEVLILPNAWNRLSARLFAGLPACQALGTTSAGIAAALGYPDGEQAPLDELLAVVRQITAAVALLVTGVTPFYRLFRNFRAAGSEIGP